MPEPDAIEPTQVPGDETELVTLRQAHAEVLAKRKRDKEQIASLEVAAIAMQEKVTKAEANVQDAVVGIPLRRMADEISAVPALWLRTFNEHFKLESKDGVLTVLTADGKPAVTAKGEPVAFTREGLSSYLTEHDVNSERTKVFRVLTITSRASGAGSQIGAKRSDGTPKQTIHFGLR